MKREQVWKIVSDRLREDFGRLLDVRDVRRVRRVSGDAWVVTVVLAAPSGDLHVADVTVDDAGTMTPVLGADHVVEAVRRAAALLAAPPAGRRRARRLRRHRRRRGGAVARRCSRSWRSRSRSRVAAAARPRATPSRCGIARESPAAPARRPRAARRDALHDGRGRGEARRAGARPRLPRGRGARVRRPLRPARAREAPPSSRSSSAGARPSPARPSTRCSSRAARASSRSRASSSARSFAGLARRPARGPRPPRHAAHARARGDARHRGRAVAQRLRRQERPARRVAREALGRLVDGALLLPGLAPRRVERARRARRALHGVAPRRARQRGLDAARPPTVRALMEEDPGVRAAHRRDQADPPHRLVLLDARDDGAARRAGPRRDALVHPAARVVRGGDASCSRPTTIPEVACLVARGSIALYEGDGRDTPVAVIEPDSFYGVRDAIHRIAPSVTAIARPGHHRGVLRRAAPPEALRAQPRARGRRARAARLRARSRLALGRRLSRSRSSATIRERSVSGVVTLGAWR